MNWSAFFQGAPEGFSKGYGAAQGFREKEQQYQQSQKMNPLLLREHELHNQMMGQGLSQGAQTFGREGNMYNAYINWLNGQRTGQPLMSGGSTMQSSPTGGGMPQGDPSMGAVGMQPPPLRPAGLQQGGSPFSQMGASPYGQGSASGMYSPSGVRGVTQGFGGAGMNPYSGQGAPWNAPWQNMGGWGRGYGEQ